MTSTRTPSSTKPEHREEWAADGSTRAFVIRGVILVAIGGFLGGLIGVGVAGLAVVATWKRPARPVAAAAAAALLAAAFASVFEVVPQEGALRSNYAEVRPIASGFGLAAGVLAIVAVATMAVRERAPRRSVADPTATDLPRAERPGLVSSQTRASVARLAPYGVVAGVALLVRFVLASTALPGSLHQLVANLRIGAGYVLGSPGSYRATGAHSPVPVVLGAFAPGGGSFSLLVAGVATVVLAMALTYRLAGQAAAVLAGIGVLLVQVATGQHLPSAAAAALLLLAAFLGRGQSVVSARAVLAGVAIGLAVLSEPWALLGLPLLVAWMVLDGRRSVGAIRAAIAALAVAVVTVIPWQRYLAGRFDTWLPSTDMSFGLGSAAAFLPLAVVAAAVLLAPRLPPR